LRSGGNDRLGIGDSVLHVAGQRDRAHCGPGQDAVGEHVVEEVGGIGWKRPDSDDMINFDCEDVPFVDSQFGIGRLPGFQPAPVRRDQTAWTFSNPCRRARLGSCTGRLTMTSLGARRPFAQTTFTERGTVRVALGTAARRLARARRIAIRVSATLPTHETPSVAFILAR